VAEFEPSFPKDGKTAMSEHCLIPGEFFTLEQWRGPLAPWVDRLVATPGAVLLIAVEVAPERRNYPCIRFAVFDGEERKALRALLLEVKKKRKAAQKAFKPDEIQS
jgi:hypothetical protein